MSPALARTGMAVAAARRMLVERDLAAGCRGLAEQECGAGRRVDLGLVVHFQDFDIKTLVERLRDALDQRRQQIDAEAHIARLHHDGALGDALDDRIIGRRQSGGADDMHEAALGGDRDIGDGGGRAR